MNQLPQASNYVDALNKLKTAGKGTPQQWDMLAAHYHAHNRSASYTELGKSVGYDGKTANGQYGKFGSMLGEELKMNFERISPTDPETIRPVG